MNLSRELSKLKEEIASHDKKVNLAEGQIQQIKDNMKEKYGIETLEEAKELLEKKIERKEKLQTLLEKEVSEIREEINRRI